MRHARPLSIAAAIAALALVTTGTPFGDAGAGSRHPLTCSIRIKETSERSSGETRIAGRTRTALGNDRLAHESWWLNLSTRPDQSALRAGIEPLQMASCVRTAELASGHRFDRADVRLRYRGDPARDN